MAIMRTGPGKKAKSTSSGRKVTSKDVVNKVRDIFGAGSGRGKTKGGSAAAGVASRSGGVRTLTSAKVTGSKKAGIQSLKAKKKSGEMSRQEANAKIKNLRGVAVKPRTITYGEYAIPRAGESNVDVRKYPAMDSAAAMNYIKTGFPGVRGQGMVRRLQESMAGSVKKGKLGGVHVSPKGGVYYSRTTTKGNK